MSEDTSAARHPDLADYVSKTRRGSQRWYLQYLPRWLPTNKSEWTRVKINSKLWMYFDGRVRFQKYLGASCVLALTWVFICWMEDISPYLALSEDPNTAFRHPHWVEL